MATGVAGQVRGSAPAANDDGFLVGLPGAGSELVHIFFSGPVIAELLIVFCLGAAIFTAKQADDREEQSAQTGFESGAALTG